MVFGTTPFLAELGGNAKTFACDSHTLFTVIRVCKAVMLLAFKEIYTARIYFLTRLCYNVKKVKEGKVYHGRIQCVGIQETAGKRRVMRVLREGPAPEDKEQRSIRFYQLFPQRLRQSVSYP